MIRSVDNSEAAQAPQPTSTPTQVAPATAAGKTFASVLASKKAAATGGTAAPTSTPANNKLGAPDGEEWAPVAGHDNAAKITSGPRAGQYINLSHGDRRGQTFAIEQRDGKEVHVYGTGDTEKVIGAKQDVTDGARVINGKRYENGATVPKGERWAPVSGHDSYADILSGKRNGLFVNISGGVRDGMAFQIVKHGQHTYHVYGSGKHRQVIEVGAKKSATDTTPTSTGGTTPTTSTNSPASTTTTTGGATSSTT
ncbi:MAG: hypothetical protein QOF37_1705 [Thermoleophilaceae bacterium]|jgi:hypothetical protein|nr:hypothetical protein [Thermoleophilaceae bacterium]